MTAFAILALALLDTRSPGAAFQDDEPASLYRSIVPNPTNRNGYEEYLQAADLLRTPRFREAWNRANVVKPGAPAWLATQRAAVGQAGDVRGLVATGNGKPVSDPRPSWGPTTTFKEYAHFKNVVKVLKAQAHIQFVDGSPKDGVQTVLTSLKFSFNVEGIGVLITYLVGVACQSIALTELSEHMDQIPSTSLRSVTETADAGLGVTTLVNCLATESQATDAALVDAAKDRRALDVLMEGVEEEQAVKKAAEAMTPAQYAKSVDRARGLCHAYYAALANLSLKPETQWTSELAKIKAALDGESDPVAKFLSSSLMVVSEQVFSTEAKRRTQLRLLRLHMAIQKFRQEAYALPRTLADLNDQNLSRDPLNGKDFVYEPKGQTYELYSLGAFETGRIDLV